MKLCRVFFTLFTLFYIPAYAQNQFTLSGKIPPEYDGTDIKLWSENQGFQRLATKAKNGQFKFSSQLNDEFEHVFLVFEKSGELLGSWDLFIKSAAMSIEILSFQKPDQKNNIRVFNVPFHNDQEQYNSVIKPYDDSVSSTLRLVLLRKKGLEKRYSLDSLVTKEKQLRHDRLKRKIEFINSNPGSYMALYLFNEKIIQPPHESLNFSADSLMSIFSGFSTNIKGTNYGRSVQAYLAKRQSLLINNQMPDFSFTTTDNKYYQLSSFRNSKYVLICFWNSGYIPCIKSIPLFNKLYKQYKDKGLHMLSVSMDRDTTQWKKSLQRFAPIWPQTCDLPEFIKGPRIESLYDITYIPQYFLIDKEGKLIYHNAQLGDDDDYNILQKMLKELLH